MCQIIIHKDYSEDKRKGNDIAILHVRDAIPYPAVEILFPIEDCQNVELSSLGWFSESRIGAILNQLRAVHGLRRMEHKMCEGVAETVPGNTICLVADSKKSLACK